MLLTLQEVCTLLCSSQFVDCKCLEYNSNLDQNTLDIALEKQMDSVIAKIHEKFPSLEPVMEESKPKVCNSSSDNIVL